MAFGFVQLPSLVFGVDHYTVTVELPEAGGLYERSNVTYRGTEVGTVEQVDLTDTGVEARALARFRYRDPIGPQCRGAQPERGRRAVRRAVAEQRHLAAVEGR